MSGPPHLDAGRIYRLTPFEEVVDELRTTFAAGPSVAPSQRVALGNGSGDLLVLPAVIGRLAGAVAVRPSGAQGLYTLFGGGGDVVATLDGAALTARRTPAVSALVTDALARTDVRRLAVFGTGVQAREHVRAMRWVRPSLEQIDVVGRESAATERFVAMLRGEGHPAVAASAVDASSADLICTCTSSSQPVLINDAVKPGAHINAVGTDQPDRREVDDQLMGRSRVVVDDWEAARTSGDLLLAVAAGTMSWEDMTGDLVALARGSVRRETHDEVTLFVSVGLGMADLVVATLAARNAGLVDS
ncbi:ornithine cyclodeaminase family protein [Kribbella sp. VKM Ac-2568]|uniref:ornithine cyclodeaminase family protein n=1 Tax=Kribbella sp. VKM Ac-2568 TaxID=2512219 RepID=UPI0010E82FDE|nr:ornithine cyclodeaminase family protein [Kribbella sp. VKM Ac-2568]TCM39630.1 ornithine cyclodeaminase/thiomorpholine-carboxylate dehydrogenase [Kribbella sp. VKM Ac-2568]